jgi:hypothetical protein
MTENRNFPTISYDLVDKWIKQNYPDEYEIVGPETVKQLVQTSLSGNKPTFVRSDRGSDLDITEIIILLCTVLQGVSSVIDIVNNWSRPSDSMSLDEVKAEVYARLSPVERNQLNDNNFHSIMVATYDYLRSRHDE